MSDDEEKGLRSTTLQTAKKILLARRRAERELALKTEELAHSLARLQATLESTSDGILVTSEQAQITGFNRKFVELFQVAEELLKPNQIARLQTALSQQMRSPQHFLDRFHEIEARGLPQSFDVLELADGRRFERSSKIQQVDQRTTGRVWSFRDISTHYRLTLQLQQQQEWLRVTLSSIGDAVIATNTEGRITFLNAAAETMTGWTSDDALNQVLTEVFKTVEEPTAAPRVDAESNFLGNGVPAQGVHRALLISRAGNIRSIEDMAAPIRDSTGHISGVVRVFRDVSELRRSEDALRISHAQSTTIINQSPVGICVVDAQFRIHHVNPRAHPMLGSQTSALGRDLEAVIHLLLPGSVAQDLIGEFRRTLATGESFIAHRFAADRIDRKVREYYDIEIHRISLSQEEYGVVAYFTDTSAYVRAQFALRESEEKFGACFHQAAIGMAIASLQGQFEQVNQRMVDLLGFSAQELCERTFAEITYPEDRRQTHAQVRRLLAGEISDYSLEKRYLRKDGRIFWSLTTVTVLKDAEGRPQKFIGIVEDITQRKWTEEMARESAQHLELAMAAGRLGDWTWSLPTDSISLSRRTLDTFGLAPGTSFTWRQLRQQLPEEDREAAHRAFEAALATHSIYEGEYRITRSSHELCWVAVKGQGVYGADGRALGMTGVVQDITDRKRTEEAAREEHIITEQLNGVARALASELELSKVVKIICDAGTRITRAQYGALIYKVFNSDGVAQTHFTCSGLKLTPALSMGPAADMDCFSPDFWGDGLIRVPDVRPDPRFGKAKTILGIPAANCPIISYLAVPIFSRSRQIVGGLFFGHASPGVFKERDEKIIVGVSAQAAAAMDTARIYHAEQKAREAAEQANQAKDHFLAALSHELRTPLTPVLAILANLRDELTLPKAVIAELETIRRNVELEARLIDDLLDLTRVTRGKLELHVTNVQLGQVIDDAIKTCWPDLKAKRLSIETHIHNPRQLIQVDSARVTQILWNLLNNSTKFTPPEGTIRIRTGVQKGSPMDQLTIEIQDTGMGIEPANLERVFAAFEQGDRKITRQFGGLGLGLAISKAIAQSHQGTLTAVSPGVGRGSTFTLTLPLDGSDFAREDSPPTLNRRSKEKSRPDGVADRPLRILLVDDHVDTSRSLCTLLQRRGYVIGTANDVVSALRLAATQRFDILLSDLGLPDASGYELMRQIQSLYPVPGIAISGYGMEEDIRKCREAGFSEHLVKPIQISQLEAALARIMALRRPN